MLVTIKDQKGAASIFVVVFTSLVVVLITVSFIRIMLSGQQQTTVNDLSQSAYDSAQAGVEDAKRALLKYQNICATGTAAECAAAYNNVSSSTCNYANSLLTDVAPAVDSTTGEVRVQTNVSNNLDQAYTCVKIIPDTDDYTNKLDKDNSKIIPLVGTASFDTVKIEWFSSADIQGSGTGVDVPLSANGVPLLAQDIWTSATTPNRPPIVRANLVQFNSSGFSLSDFDNNTTGVAASSTMFLYPSSVNGVPASGFPLLRKTPTFSPVKTLCIDSLVAGGYACSAMVKLPIAVSAGDRTAYLNLKSLYKDTHYRLTLWSGTVPVKFNAVQPMIDSTGRANDLFRRVEARVELGDTEFPFPEAAVDTTGSFCKNFIITDKESDYTNNCNP